MGIARITVFVIRHRERFTTVDPIKMAATSTLSPQSLNLYAYTENDPVNKTDPEGLDHNQLHVNVYGAPWPTGGTGFSIPSWLSSFLNGILGNIFGGGNQWYPGMQVGPTVYFWQFNTASITPSAPPPLPGAGTTANVLSPSPDYSTTDCLNNVMSFLGKYVSGEGGSLGVVKPPFVTPVGKLEFLLKMVWFYD